MQENEKLKVIPIGGVEEIGINCTAIEYQNQIVVVDMGLGFGDAEMYGVDYVVPNITYLEENKHKIEGIIITHGHLDHIGALPYLLPRLDFPEIYGTKFTIELIKSTLEDKGGINRAKFNVIEEDSVLHSGNFGLSFFRVNHSIPQAVGVVLETPAGRIVHTGDFKFDNSPVNEPVADYARLAEIGNQGVDLLLSDSTNSLRKGHPISESEIARRMEEVVEHASGRVFIAAFSGLVGRLYQLIKIAEKYDRKVAIAGYSMNKTLRIAQEIGYINPKKGTIVPIQRINRYKDEKVMILTTGSQGERNAALARMADEGYKNTKLKKGDFVVISANTIPGNNASVQSLIDSITATGAQIHQSEHIDFFTSGHGYQEDQKIMLNLVKPHYFMPVHGYQYFLREHGLTAQSVGIPEERVIIPKRGSVIVGNKHIGFKEEGRVKNTPLLVSGLGVGDVGASLLSERKQLANSGVLVIQINIDKKTKAIKGSPTIIPRGFVYVKTHQEIIDKIESIITTRVEERRQRTRFRPERLKEELTKEINNYVTQVIGREPMILVLLNQV